MKNQILLVVLTVMLGCAKDEPSTEVATFSLRGVVVSISHEKKRIVIDHEEIPDYMKAMTMPFKVKDSTLLTKVRPGDSVLGILAVSRAESWLESLTVVGTSEEPATPSSAADAMFRRIYKEGEKLPDLTFVNQDGKRVKLSDYRGKTVAMTFVYSRCPLPDFCIRMSDHFARIQKNLKRDASLSGKWHLLTISFDPEFDSPEVMKRYGKSYGADFSVWEFVTDSLNAVVDLADGLGLVTDDDEGGLIAHNLRTAVIDQNGSLVLVYKGNEWTAKELEDAIRAAILRAG
ncbi:MAG TPA: SCO family protein [Bacteroidota bacterium]